MKAFVFAHHVEQILRKSAKNILVKAKKVWFALENCLRLNKIN